MRACGRGGKRDPAPQSRFWVHPQPPPFSLCSEPPRNLLRHHPRRGMTGPGRRPGLLENRRRLQAHHAQRPCRLDRPLNPKPPASLALPLGPHPPLLFQYEGPWATQKPVDQALVTNYPPPMTYCFTSNMRPITCRAATRTSMSTSTKEQIQALSPAQQEAFGHLEAESIRRRQALLRQTRASRIAYRIILTLGCPAAGVAFVVWPSGRSWVLLLGLLVLVALITALNQRLDALTELLEGDLKRAANGEEDRNARVP